MKRTIYPIRALEGSVIAPASKSHAQRVLACALISRERTVIHGLGNSDDELVALGLLEHSILKPILKEGSVTVPSGDKLYFSSNELSFGESGLSSRMFTPILANGSQELQLIGKGSLASRPMRLFNEVFSSFGVEFSSDQGTLPFKLKGPLIPADITLDGSLSSQFITGFIYAFVANERTTDQTITIENPTSVPYIELSLDVLRSFGIEIELKGNEVRFNGPYRLKETEITIEGDWSSASFLLVGAALFGSIRMNGLNKESKQADIRLLQALNDFGANVSWEGETLVVSKQENNSFEFDATHCPDLFPPLAVLASHAKGVSRIHGVHRLFSKESNRAVTIVEELTKLGAKIQVVGDTMIVHPRGEQVTDLVSSRHDHRIAMACAIFALGLQKETTILNADSVRKSFPEFYTYLEELTLKQ